jgi:hypothetical protein
LTQSGIRGRGGLVTQPGDYGSIKKKNGKFSLWRVPNFLMEARGYYFGERDSRFDFLAKARAFFGVVILVVVAYAYPGYTGPAGELIPTTGYVWPGIRTLLRFDSIWLTSIVYSLALLVIMRVIRNSPVRAFADLHLIVSKVLVWARRV